ncbi:DNA (cytosine-5-)-methyltransferase [Streptococcus infantis SK970]|nr:DNA (cytosine-5-)-methyltransferase [Streptococcus infantis SK970]
MNVIDLFSGAGGLSLGFIKDGHTVTKAVEFDDSIAHTYKMNHPGVEVIIDDIANIDKSGVFKEGDASIIIGGPPCQGFSMAGARIRNGFMDDPRNYLFKHYFNVVKTVKPDIFIMENVKGIQTMQDGKIFSEIIRIFSDPELLDGNPYKLYYRVINASDFGIPQKRERMIIIGTKNDNVDFEFLWEKTIKQIQKEDSTFFNTVTVRDAISNLGLETSDGIVDNPLPLTDYQKFLSSNSEKIHNHTKTNHSPIAIERMSKIRSGENFKVLDEKIKSIHSGSYGRLSWEDLAPTITTRFDTPSGGRFIHPIYNRTLTPREAARIQSFPDDYIFYGKKSSIIKQIGNAVPPKFSYFLSRLVDNILER